MANYGPPGGQYPGSPQEPWSPRESWSPQQEPWSPRESWSPQQESWSQQDREPTGEYRQPADPWGDNSPIGGDGQFGAGGPFGANDGYGGAGQYGGGDRWGAAYPGAAGHPGSAGHPGTVPGQPDPGAGYPPATPYHAGQGTPPHPAGPVSPPPGWTAASEPMWNASPTDSDWSTPQPVPPPRRGVGRLVATAVVALVVLAATGVAIGIYVSGRETRTLHTQPSTPATDDVQTVTGSPESATPTRTAAAAAPSTDATCVSFQSASEK